MPVGGALRRFATWPVFLALATVHIVVFPLLLSEHEDDVVALVAGAFYLALAALDLALRHRRPGAGPGLRQ